MQRDASDLVHCLARDAEAVCRHYLSNGRRQGSYWLVGDARNTPGCSMFVRLKEFPKRPAGKWTDAATGEHGDLLDIIRQSCGLLDFRDVAEEARRFLSLPRPDLEPESGIARAAFRSGAPEAARRLFAVSRSISGTLVEAYLSRRAISNLRHEGSLRFHPRCYYRSADGSPVEIWPAMIARVTDLDGGITGVHRTWLDPERICKAPIDTPRRAMGNLLGNAVRFGQTDDVLVAGEGIETVLSLRNSLSALPMAAALSASHLGAMLFPRTLRRLYIARDRDAAGDASVKVLTRRAEAAGVESIVLSPQSKDFNDDLRNFGADALKAALRIQLAPEDMARFLV
jgi:hypothetical protein